MGIRLIKVLVIIFLYNSSVAQTQYLGRECKKLTNDNFKESIDLVSKPLAIAEGKLIAPVKTILLDKYLIISDLDTQKNTHIIDIEEEKYLGQFIDIGSGPNQISRLGALSKIDDTSFLVSDPYEKKYIGFKVDKLLNSSVPYTRGTYEEDGHLNFLDYDIKNNKLFYSGLLTQEYRLFEKDINSGAITGHEQLLSSPSGTNTIEVKNFLSIAKVARFNSHFAFAYEGVPLVEIFDYKNQKLTSVLIPHSKQPKYFTSVEEGETLLGITRESIYEFLDIRITDKYVYALYRGQEFSNEEPKKSVLYVLDYKLTPIKKYNLDAEIVSIAIHNDTTMYAIQTSPFIRSAGGSIRVYDLN